MNGTLLPLRYYVWAIGLGGLLIWSVITGHLAWHKAAYVCTGKYVYSRPTQWYVKAKLGSLEWRSSNSVYDCPPINQVPVLPGQKVEHNSVDIPPAASQNWTGQ